MPDIRELILLDQMETSRFAVSAASALRSRVRLGLRRLVVQTSVPPLTMVYAAIYRLHLRYALHVLKQFPGIHSIYVTGGLASGEVRPGISDVDLTVNGEWTDEEQMKVAYALRRLSTLSPLYDTLLGQCTQTLTSLQALYETDYFFQYRFDLGRSRWKLVHGEDVFALLPPADPDKAAGGAYTELRTWWAQFTRSAFGSGAMARDGLFRNSIAYKAVASIEQVAMSLDGEAGSASRSEVLAVSARRAVSDESRNFLAKMTRSGDGRHLRFDGDILEETFRYLMPRMEEIHSRLGEAAAFQAAGGALRIDASAAEMMVTSEARESVSATVAYVKERWSGYRAAYLVPSLSFFFPDDLVLLIEVDPARLPTVKQVRELCRLPRPAGLRQRVAPFLLLPNAAYQLEVFSGIELWHHTLCPAANPEVFSLLPRQEFVVDGAARASHGGAPVWTRFAANQVKEEVTIRREAFGKAAGAAQISSLDVLRHLWRQVQLEIVVRSGSSPATLLPLTVPAMLRALRSWGLPEDSVFSRLAAAYQAEMDGTKVDVYAMLPEVMGLLALFR